MNADRIIVFSVWAMAVAIPWWPGALPVLLILFLLAALLSKQKGARTFDLRSPLPWMAMFYLWHVTGMLWSEDVDFGLLDLGIKLSMLVVPLAVWWRSGSAPFSSERVLKAFVISCAAFMAILIFRGAGLYAWEAWSSMQGRIIPGAPYWNHMFSSYLTWYVHPSYVAYYLVIALAAWTLTDLYERVSPAWTRVVLLVLVIGVVLCNSKMGWIALALLGPYVLVVRWRKKGLRRTLLMSGVVAIVGFGALYVTVPGVRGKVTDAVAAMKMEDASAHDSSSARRTVWHAALQLATEAPLLGQGTGDVKNELIERYERNGYVYALEHRLNAHSQFLQTQVALGLVGSILLIGSLLFPLIVAFRRRDHLLIVFLLCTALNWSVESMLEVQAGVLPFMFIAMVLTWKQETPVQSTAADKPSPVR